MAELTQSARLAALIDHTSLKPEATRAEIEKLCAEATQFSFASVCVQPYRVALAADLLKDTSVKICSVIGFPFGAGRAEVKAMEVVRAVADGAQELDMVLNIGAFKDGNRAACENDIKGVVKAAQDRTVKVILETALLDHFEITEACKIAEGAGAHYVKTSTGFSRAGATVDHVKLMRKTVGDRLGVKASGGIRDLETFTAMVEAGASRIGTSHGVAILSGLTGQGDY